MIRCYPFSRDQFSAFLTFVAEAAAIRWPAHTYLMTSDVAWQFPGCGPKDNIRLWDDGNGLAAYAWFQPPDSVTFDVRPGLPGSDELGEEILNWAEIRRRDFPPGYPWLIELENMDQWADAIRNPSSRKRSGNCYLVATAFEGDGARTALLTSHGFVETQHFAPFLSRSLSEPLPVPEPPAGLRLRHVEPADFERRVAVHRASWAPGSSFTLEQYLKVRGVTEVFDPSLDIVAETTDGTFASCTIAWKDSISGIGSFEPFGTRPEWRGSGVSRAVLFEGFRRLAARGMHSAKLSTAGFNHAAQKLYESCGFARVDTNRTFMKQC